MRPGTWHVVLDGSAGKGNTMGPSLPWGPMAALTNPIVLAVE